jgi:methyl-accepting chemotaxis protein
LGQNQTLKAQFAWIVVTMLVGFMAFGGIALITLERLKVNGPIYQEIVLGKDLIADVLPPPAYIVEANLVAHQIVRESNAAARDKLVERFNKLEKEFNERAEFWRGQDIAAPIKGALLDRSVPPARQFFDIARGKLLPAVSAANAGAAASALAEMGAQFVQHQQAIGDVVTQAEADNRRLEEGAAGSITAARVGLVAAFVIALALCIALTALITRRLMRQLGGEPHKAAEVARAIAAGRLKTEVVPGADDNSLMTNMARMRDGLRDTVSDLTRCSTSLVDAAGALSHAAAQVASGSESQSDATSSTAAAVEQFAVSLEQITGNAQAARDSATEAGRVTERAGAAVTRTLDEMHEIANAVNHSSTLMAELENHATRISAVVSVIREVADQTNLLALNAAIEAARAGEQGRGFAVVADEVRKLAERTSSSTQEITAMVAAIQQATGAAAEGLDAGRRKVESGVNLAGETRDAMSGLADKTRMMLAAVEEISNALQEQGNARTEITRNVERVAQMTEENTAAVHSIRESVDTLNQLALDLKGQVTRFDV